MWGMSEIQKWFEGRGWKPFQFQKEVWAAYAAGRSGLIHAPTGLGKTLAAWLGPLAGALAETKSKRTAGLKVLWLTPLRALAVDTTQSLREPLAALGLDWTVEMRTGDTSQKIRTQLKKRLPEGLVTTPESLSVMMSYGDARERMSGVDAVIVDEWHELLSSKRGVQTELCLARLREWNPGLRLWGLSATIGNLPEAMRVLLGTRAEEGVIVTGEARKDVRIETLLPDGMDRFPWSGHLGTRMVPAVVGQIEQAGTTLLFTNTRSQTELWYQALLEYRPEWAADLAMHHGSMEKAERTVTEERLREGSVKCVVCTSSLDLGVDFSPVDQVIQVGSPKGMARLMQRAGRSGHRPGAVSRVFGVPTNAFELVEFAAARGALAERKVEARRPLRMTLDVLAQHLLTVAAGGGFEAEAMRREVMSTHAFEELDDASWEWLLGFITTGGRALRAYPQFAKVQVENGHYHMADDRLARLHRLSIGTISSDTAISIQYAGGRRLGSVEEWFISKIKPGGLFIFSGRRLELVRYRDLKAVVKDAAKKRQSGQIPSWQGGKSPLSTELASAVSRKLEEAGDGDLRDPELQLFAPILELQKAWSVVPRRNQLLIEETTSREGNHVYVYPFAGRLVHEGLGTLVAWRMARERTVSITVSFNDYGFELFSRDDLSVDEARWRQLLGTENLLEDLLSCMNTAELAKRQFRGIARVAGLVLMGYPGNPKTAKSLQVSSSLLYDVFCKYDPDNLLIAQARREILDQQLELTRLQATLEGLRERSIVQVFTKRLTPMAFPLWADLLSSSLSTESFGSRLEKMLEELEEAALHPDAPENRPER
ncbi:MAG: box helicase [Verrucomicrobiales bacterium]|nr:box helicase [Verrucomicrobiales bacterium]